MATCGPCETTGFVNLDQVPESVVTAAEASPDFCAAILTWIKETAGHDVSVCSCCGDGEAEWHDEPGYHNEAQYGKTGPYEYNGGLPECF
jgi:hypothetical protein